MSARRVFAAAVVVGVSIATALPSYAHPGHDHGHHYGQTKNGRPASDPCVGDPHDVQTLAYPVKGQTATALYALPASKPRGIVVFDHGYGHTSYRWQQHIARTAATLGVSAIAPDYRGQIDTP